MLGAHPFQKGLSSKAIIKTLENCSQPCLRQTLILKDPLNVLKHCTLNKNDKTIWDKAYEEEYMGLRNLPTWTTITDTEYQANKSTYGTLLLTMAISAIKYDQDGYPKRAKYTIVALGDLDPHDWSKADCFVPVMSLMEVRLMTALAVKHKCALQSGDFKQAFVQSTLLSSKTYALKLPHGYPLTPKHAYWLLEREKMILNKIGLSSCANSPCIFSSTLIKNKAPVYLGLYVDDFVFF